MIESAQDWRWLLYALLVAAAVGDVRALRIPNVIPLSIVAALLIALLAASAPADTYLKAATSGVIGLAVGYGFFALGLMGGGDGKLFAAAASWFTAGALLSVGLWISLAGIVVAMTALVFRAAGKKSFEGDAPRSALKTPIPYGVAIAAGVIIAAQSPALL